MKSLFALSILLALSFILPLLGLPDYIVALWPAVCALTLIVLTKSAAAGLGLGVVSGVILLNNSNPLEIPRALFADILFPSLEGSWHLAALLFTLILGAFAGLLEKSGGFETILRRMLAGAEHPQRRLLGSVYVLGLVCFFDGLANALLTGRIARPLADRVGVSRERLAWVVDSTSSPVACVAFVSTWIATQLSLIEQGLSAAPFEVSPYQLFFQSIPANPYCLLTLLLVPAAIILNYQPRAMRRYAPKKETDHTNPDATETSPRRAVLPLLALLFGIFFAFPLLSQPIPSMLSAEGWKTAFSGDAGPYALVVGALIGLAAAWAAYPKGRTIKASGAALSGAANLLPALIVLILAWSLGNVFTALGAADQLAQLFSERVGINWIPLAVFLSGAMIAISTGSSWGTMALLMPLALPATLVAAAAQELSPELTMTTIPMVIGAVFGGAVLGDHCSPFSDTTIVSSIAAGCEPVAHVHSQLPFVSMVAVLTILAYALMALGVPAVASTAVGSILLVLSLTRLSRGVPSQESRRGLQS